MSEDRHSSNWSRSGQPRPDRLCEEWGTLQDYEARGARGWRPEPLDEDVVFVPAAQEVDTAHELPSSSCPFVPASFSPRKGGMQGQRSAPEHPQRRELDD